jgi:hypothetical protein
VPNKVGWSYVVRYEPRGRPVKYIVLEEDDNEENEQDDVEDQVDVCQMKKLKMMQIRSR